MDQVFNECLDKLEKSYDGPNQEVIPQISRVRELEDNNEIKVAIFCLIPMLKTWRHKRAREVRDCLSGRALKKEAESLAKLDYEDYLCFQDNLSMYLLVKYIDKETLRMYSIKYQKPYTKRDSKMTIASRIAESLILGERPMLVSLSEQAIGDCKERLRKGKIHGGRFQQFWLLGLYTYLKESLEAYDGKS